MPRQTVETISLNPKYIPLVQRPCCCCVTCLQMILYRRGFGLFDQEELAKDLKIKICEHDLDAYNIKLDTYADPIDAGIKTTESEGIINQIFNKNNISLVANGVRASEIQNLENFITDNLKKNNDLWMEWMIYKVYDEKQHKKQWNMPEWMNCHDSIIESIEKSKQDIKVTIVDPFWYHKPRSEINLEKIQKALVGFIVISSEYARSAFTHKQRPASPASPSAVQASI